MPPSTNKKRPNEGGADDARARKRISQGATAPSSNSASAEEFDLPALTSLADASRRYDEWKGDIGDGIHRTFSGGGALFPTNYKLYLKHRAPWVCPLVNCRKSFPQCSNLGHHFSKAHRGLKLYDDAESGLFHSQGMRTKPDKDGRLRPIVVERGLRAPGDDRQAPAAAAATAAPASTAARAVNSSTLAPIIPAQAARPSSRKVIDISSDDEDVKPVVRDTPVGNTGSRVPAQREQARGETKSTGTANRVRKNGHGAMFEVNNPQQLGGARHHRNVIASWEQEADKDGLSKSNHEDDDDSDPFDFEPSDLPVLRKNATQQQETGTDTSPTVLADSKQPSDPSKSAIWRYLMTLTKTEIPVPDHPAITELLTLPKRRNLPRTWQRKLSMFREFQLNTLSGLVLYIGGDEASSSPCEWMGCSAHPEAHIFWRINFYHGSSIDHRFPFPKCVFLPNNLHDSVPIIERLGHHLCCNAYSRSWMKPPHWMNTVPNEKLKAAQDMARVEVTQNTSTNKSAGTDLSTSIPGNMPNSVTTTSKPGNNAVEPSPSQASIPAGHPLQPATMVRDTTTPRGSGQQADTKSNGAMSKARPHDTKSGQVTPTIQPNHRPVPPSGSQVSLPNVTPVLSAKRNEERNSMTSSRLHEQTQPSQASTTVASTFSQLAVVMQQTVSPRRLAQEDSSQPATVTDAGIESESESSPADCGSDESEGSDSEAMGGHSPNEGEAAQSKWKGSKEWMEWKRKMKKRKLRRAKSKRLKRNRQARRDNEKEQMEKQRSLASQTNHTPVSAAAASLSNLTVQDTSTAPSRSPQQGGPEQSQKTTVFNLANGSTQPIGFKGEESQLLQASKRQTLECTVWAGSVKIKIIGDDGMSVTRRVDVGGTWTVDPDSHCLVSSFFPAAQETAVVNVRSKPV